MNLPRGALAGTFAQHAFSAGGAPQFNPARKRWVGVIDAPPEHHRCGTRSWLSRSF